MIRAATKAEIEYICTKIDYAPSVRCNGIIINNDISGIGAACIYDTWTHSAVQMHGYSTDPKYLFNPAFCRAMFEYPFVEQHKMLAFTVTPCDNTASIALARFLGFKEVYRIRDGWKPGTDMVIQELRRENCRFLESNLRVPNALSECSAH